MNSNQQGSGIIYTWCRVLFLLGLGFLLINSIAYGQNCKNPLWKEEPLPPVFEYVTMDPESGITSLHWRAPEPSPNRPEPAGYYIYRIEVDASGNEQSIQIKEVGPNTFQYEDMDAKANEGPVSYRLASKGTTTGSGGCNGSGDPSVLTDKHTTIFATLTYDSCQDKITLQWSLYEGWGNHFARYIIYSGENRNWTTLKEKARLEKKSHVKYIEENVLKKREYFYYIEIEHDALKKDGQPLKTRSNLLRVKTRDLQIRRPSKIDSIISMERGNAIYFSYDSLSRVSHFEIIRQATNSELAGKLQYAKVDSVGVKSGRKKVIDSIDGSDTHARKHYYYVATIDQCGDEVAQSPLLNSTTLRAVIEKESPIIRWDAVEVEEGSSVVYSLYRTTFSSKGKKGNWTASTEKIADIKDGAIEFHDDVSRLGKEIGSDEVEYLNKFVYFIVARVINAQGLTEAIIKSYPHTEIIPSSIKLPDAINPIGGGKTLSNGIPRNLFGPWSKRSPDAYTLYVINRSGETIYVGDSTPWDGRLPNGNYAPEGAYLYRLVVHIKGRASSEQLGSFMVIYQR